MDNQHRKISGYRDLSEAEIALLNKIKAEGERLASLIAEVRAFAPPSLNDPLERAAPGVDPRWVGIGYTHLQQGLMALTRAVAKPDSFA